MPNNSPPKKLLLCNLPKRKKKALCIEDGVNVYPIAYFVSDEAAKEFIEMFTIRLEGKENAR